MILKTEYQLPVQRPAIETSVQPDGMIGEHRARENSQSSECDPSPRRAAVDTRSEEPATPPQSPAFDTGSEKPGTPLQSPVIGMGSEEPGASRAPFETSIDGFLRSNFTSTGQEYIVLQSNVGVNDSRVQPEVGMDDNNNATTQQAAIREEFVSRSL